MLSFSLQRFDLPHAFAALSLSPELLTPICSFDRGDDACNAGFVMVTKNRFRVAQYVCYGALMAQAPGAFGTLGFLFLADDVAICPTEMIAELSANPRVPRFSDLYNDRQADALILEHVRDGPNSTFFAAGTPYKK